MSLYHRKAIAKSGLQHLSAQPCASALAKCELDREIRSSVDWSVSSGCLQWHCLPVLHFIGQTLLLIMWL